MPGTSLPPFSSTLLGPRHWPAWIGLGMVWLTARLPYQVLRAAGAGLGRCFGAIPTARRRIAERNLAVCFPKLDADARRHLLHSNMRDVGIMLAEFCLGWMGSERALARIPVQIDGLEHLRRLRAQGRGVLLVGGHFSHLELCARLVSRELRIAGMYRRMDSAVFEWAVLRARLQYAEAMFDKNDIRGCVRYLRAGGVLWYAPDQDMRGKGHVFAPFFGVPAASISATHHLARLSDAVVVPFFHRRLPAGGYEMRLDAPLADFPSADVIVDAARINALIEDMVRQAPEQYLWVHKRFKTRPPDAAPVYD